MKYFEKPEMITVRGRFIGNLSGYYSFHLENDEIITFDVVNTSIFKKIDLKNNEYKNKAFVITYSEIFDNLEEDDNYIIFKLENLEKL